MADTDRDVFEYFRRDPATAPEAAALAYASFAFDKYQWMKKAPERSGVAPTHERVERWISELPDSRLEEIKLTAGTVFKVTVHAYRESAK